MIFRFHTRIGKGTRWADHLRIPLCSRSLHSPSQRNVYLSILRGANPWIYLAMAAISRSRMEHGWIRSPCTIRAIPHLRLRACPFHDALAILWARKPLARHLSQVLRMTHYSQWSSTMRYPYHRVIGHLLGLRMTNPSCKTLIRLAWNSTRKTELPHTTWYEYQLQVV